MADTLIVKGSPRTDEFEAGEILTPGELLTFEAAGTLIANASAADVDAEKIWCAENSDIGGDMTDDYADGENVKVVFPNTGDVLFVLIDATVDLDVGSALESTGDGSLQLVTTGRILAFSLEDRTMGASNEGAKVLIA